MDYTALEARTDPGPPVAEFARIQEGAHDAPAELWRVQLRLYRYGRKEVTKNVAEFTRIRGRCRTSHLKSGDFSYTGDATRYELVERCKGEVSS